MSAIYGIIHRNQQPVSPEALNTMMEDHIGSFFFLGHSWTSLRER
jgi:hypothetical protein